MLGFWEFVVERQKIYHLRARGESAPWTDDTVLRRFHFTNIFRELDRGTRVILDAVDRHRADSTPALRAYNVAFYRAVNNDVTWESVVGGWITDVDHGVRCADEIATHGLKLFTRAWERNQHLPDGLKHGARVWSGEHIYAACLGAATLADITRALTGHVVAKRREYYPIIGKLGGMANVQTALDFTYVYNHLGELRDQEMQIRASGHGGTNNFIGPGVAAARYLGQVDRISNGFNYSRPTEQRWLRDLVREIYDGQESWLGERHRTEWNAYAGGRRLRVVDLEHALCEYDKYWRLNHGLGRHRHFTPRTEVSRSSRASDR